MNDVALMPQASIDQIGNLPENSSLGTQKFSNPHKPTPTSPPRETSPSHPHTRHNTQADNRQNVGHTIRAMLRQEEDRDGGGALQAGQGLGQGQREAALARPAANSALQGV